MRSRCATFVSLLVALVASAGPAREARGAIAACTAADIIAAEGSACPNTTAPCSLKKDYDVGDGCILDFGTRAVTITGSTDLNIGPRSVTLRAGSLTIAGGGLINGRGDLAAPNDRGGFMRIETTGNVEIQRTGSAGRIDVSGNTAAGEVQIMAGGTVGIQGDLFADALVNTGSGGAIVIDAAGDVIVRPAGTVAAGDVSATAGTGVTGAIDLRAGGKVDVASTLDLTGSDGGSLNLEAVGEIITHKVVANANGDLGSGGDVAFLAGTRIQVLDDIEAKGTSAFDGTSGGCGGTVDLDARFGDLTISGDILGEGSNPDGAGGVLTFAAVGSITVSAGRTISARSGGGQSCGGEIEFSTDQQATINGVLDVSAGAGAGVIDVFAGKGVTLGGPVIATASFDGSSGGEMRAETVSGTLLVSSSITLSGGNCDVFGFCGAGGNLDLLGCDVTLSSTGSVVNRGGNGGVVTLLAREQLTVQGSIDSTHGIGPGTDGSNHFLHPSRKPPVLTGTVVPAATVTATTTCTAFNVPSGCLVPCPTCGNGAIEFPETCDTSGTPVSCDGCSTLCQVENCNDGNVCTTDSCDPVLGCRAQAVANGTSCADALVCDGTEQCLAGFCVGTPLNCADTNSCTIDSCVEPTGCQNVQAPPSTPCSDGNACTVGDTCSGTTCQPGPAAVCNDNRECTNDSCNPASGCVFQNRTGACTDDGNSCTNDTCSGGNCLHPALANGTTCSDGAFCTVGDACQSGFCVGPSARDCSDTSQCTLDACNEAGDVCTHTPLGVGTTCTDNNACTLNDACDGAGTCVPGITRNCDDSNPCTADSCDTQTGCVHTPVAGACADDGLACTQDVCSGGLCTHPPVANNTPCNDGAFCTVNDTCQGGICAPGPVRDCADTNPCTADTCDETNDACVNTPVPVNSPCNDGNACTLNDTCDVNGICQPGPARDCNDSNVCTSEVCVPATGCVYTNLTGPCADDGLTCTSDVCAGGACTHPPVANNTPCSDGAFCTANDTCQGGVCAPGPARSCADASACTTDSCDEVNDVCVNAPLPVNTSCSDGSACTSGDLCDAGGVCQPGTPVDCNDNNPCSSESCNPTTGCQYTAVVGPCPDDGNPCTTDVCSGQTCTHPNRPNGTTCDDGFFCTIGDACQSGACTPTGPRSCNDANACTTDSCDEGGDACVNAPLASCCGNGTTEGSEECDDGNTDNADACLNTCRAAVCGDGVIRTGVELCDLGAANSDAPDAACRTNCLPRRCGDGIIDTNEQCDDNNDASGDGCSSVCFYEPPPTAERIPGKATSTKECILEWAIDRPVLDRKLRPASRQPCTNGDPACDFGTDAGDCVFHVWLCVNNQDPRLALCSPSGVGNLGLAEAKRPTAKSILTHPEDAPIRDEVLRAAAAAPGNAPDRCGPRLSIRVPLPPGGKNGSKGIGVKGTTTLGTTDSDNLRLVCIP